MERGDMRQLSCKSDRTRGRAHSGCKEGCAGRSTRAQQAASLPQSSYRPDRLRFLLLHSIHQSTGPDHLVELEILGVTYGMDFCGRHDF